MEKKNRVVLGVMLIAMMLIGSVLAVAYFLTGVSNDKQEVLTINTGSLSLIFEDNNDGMQVKSLMIGESVSKEVKITNNGDLPVTTNLNWKDLTNTYLAKSLSYKVQYKTSEEGTWTDVTAEHTNVPTSASETEVTILKDITIPTEVTYFYKITITFENTDENQESDRNAILATKFSLGEYFDNLSPSQKSLKQLGVEVKEGTPTFANTATTDEGVYAMADDYGTSYYYRGAVTNNYVKFGGFYWRIIRINGDGSLRMIYDGTKPHANGEANADRTAFNSQWNSVYDDNKYVGYMYGGQKSVASISKEQAQTNQTDSDIKVSLDNWYKNNIEDKGLSKYISDAVFCNDRTLVKKEVSGSLFDSFGPYNQLSYGKNYSRYLGNSKMIASSNDEISLICSEKNDAFTKNDIVKGNGALKYPVGLITLDEFIAAGAGKFISDSEPQNSKFYLYKGVWQWLFTPSYFGNSRGGTAFGMSYLNYWIWENDHVDKSNSVAPVINLKPEYVQNMIGTGTMTNPYRIREAEFSVQEAVGAIKNNKILLGIRKDVPNFANAATVDEGVFAMEDDYGTSYYYRGAVTNNYVKFGGFYWRIIRINGDGSLRMIYDGTSYHANGESSADRYTKTSQPFNVLRDDAKYNGYMYGPANTGSTTVASTSASEAQTNTANSDIKTVVDEWYEKNILKNAANSNEDISKYLADSVFCNDRTLPPEGETWWTRQDATHANLGWGKHVTPYGAWNRFKTIDNNTESNPVPTLKCSDNLTTGNANNDRFTVSDTKKGNGALKYPIGLITADEIVAAGSGKLFISNNAYYLYKGADSNMWSLSPYLFNNSYAHVYFVSNGGDFSGYYVNTSIGAVAPVINLKPEYVQKLIGTGVENDEYRLPDVN